jgi:hypothetical protein
VSPSSRSKSWVTSWMLLASAIGLPALLIRAVHHVGHALLPTSIAGGTAAVDVVRYSVEQPSLFR